MSQASKYMRGSVQTEVKYSKLVYLVFEGKTKVLPAVLIYKLIYSPGGIVFARESDAEGVDSLYASTPPQTDTGTDCGGSTPSFFLVTLMLSRLTLTFATGSTLMGLNLTFFSAPEGL